MASMMRWTKEDEKELRRAVTNFNKKRNRLKKLGYTNLPEKVSYKVLREGLPALRDEQNKIIRDREYPILSRREFKNTLNSLRRFSRRGAENLITLPSGERVTKWQKKETQYQRARITRRLHSQLTELDTVGEGVSPLATTLKNVLEKVSGLDETKGAERKRLLDLVSEYATADKELRRAIQWRENFLDNLETLQYENVDLLIEKVKSFENPIKLYEYINDEEFLQDFFLWYDRPAVGYNRGESSNQEYFNEALARLGIL